MGRHRGGHRVVTAALAAVIAAVSGSLLVAGPAEATTLTQLTAASFLANAVPVNQWTLPTGTTSNQACLTAGPTTSTTSVPDCSPTSDSSGSGALQLTTNANNQVGSVFNTTSLPTNRGLDVQFDSYQFTPSTTSRADGISFSLSAANPASPSAPSATGQLGGALGYSTNQSGAGIPDGYLGVGLDVYGNYLNSTYGGSACPADASLGTQKYPQSVTVRGPGNGTTGYCIVATTADTSAPSTTDNLPGGVGTLDKTSQSTHVAADAVPVEVAINSGSTSATTSSGLVVPAGSFAVAFTPLGGTASTITGTLPSLIDNSLGIPSSWYDPTTGVPYQLNFGWTASTGSANEVHDINTLTSQTVSGSLPEYSLSDVDNNSGVHNLQASGQSVTLTPSLDPASQSASAESDPPTLTDTFPSGVVPGTPTGTSWNCSGSSGQTVTCVYTGAEPVAAGATYPSVTVPLSVNSASTPGANADAAEVSSNDGLPARAADDFSVVWPPGAPSVTSHTSLDASASLTWTAPSSNGGAITGYVVTPYIWGVAQTPVTFSSPATTETVTGLTPGTAYTFTVAAENTAGTGAASASSPAVTPVTNPSITTTSVPGAEVGVGYSQTLQTTGGTAPVSWAVTTGSLPPGLQLTGGVLTGTPTTAGSTTFTVTATDADQVSAAHTYTIGVSADPTITTSTVAAGDSGSAYSQSLASSGGTGTLTWAILSGSLPLGLTLNTSTGAITGTIAATATSQTFTVQLTDSAGKSSTQTYTITVNGAPSVATSSLAGGDTSTAYHQTVTTTGGTGPYTYAVTGGSLPPGLTLNSTTGVISGTPTATGSTTFTVTSTDADGRTATKSLTVVVSGPPTVTTASLVGADNGTAYSQTLAGTGGTGPYTWAIASGAIPSGITLNTATGVLSGTPSGVGSSTFTISMTDGAGTTVTKPFTVVVSADPSVTTSSLTGADKGAAYSQTLAGTGGTGPYTWAIASGSLPAGLTLSPTGVVSGTPTATGSSTVSVRLTDADGTTVTKSFTVVVSSSPTITTASLPPGDDAGPYSQTVAISGGTGPYTFAVGAGALPAGLSLNPTTGAVSGTPSAPGSSTVTVTATDADGVITSKTFTVIIASPLGLAAGPLTGADSATPYGQIITATGGTGPFTYSVTSGSLPAGLTLNPTTGSLSGMPTGTGSSFTVTVTDATGTTSSRAYTVPVNADPTLPATTLGSADNGAPVDVTVPVSGGSGPFTYSVTGGSLPPGLTLGSSTGTITGTPTATGSATFTVKATDADGATTTQSYTMPVNAAPVVTTASMPAVDTGAPYNVTVTGSGGTGTYTYSVTGGSLPAGLTLNPTTGAITGTPTGSGTSTFTVTLSDTDGGTATKTFALIVNPPPAFTGSTITGADVGAGYDVTPASTGGTGPFTYAVTSGSLTTGLTLNPTSGAISGTPSAMGSTTFTITETDTDGNTASHSYTLTVGSPPTITTPALATADLGTTYDQALTTANGAGPFTWSVTSSSLPAGLSINPATGAISGMPSSAGTDTFTVTVTDANHQSASHVYALQTISRPSIITASVPQGTVGVPYVAALTATGGTAPYWWSGGAGLPPGLTASPFTGALTGTPTTGGLITFTVQLTDSLGQTTTRSYSINILPAPLNSRPIARTPDGKGYWLVGDNGAVLAFGDAHSYGSLAGHPLNQPIVAMAATPDGKGYWLAGTDGGVFCFGDASFYGSAGSLRLNKPILGMAATPDGRGYWLVASDGGIFSYGDARFYGSTGSIRLNKPVVGMAADSNGKGYWLVASDGGIFSFGSAPFYGSTGSMHLNKPVDGMAATPDNRGYWMVASDGGIFSFGDARFHGSLGNIHLVQPITGMAATPDGGGYWMSAADGGVFAGGNAGFYGSGAGKISQVVP